MSPQRLAQVLEPGTVGIAAAIATALGAVITELNAILVIVLAVAFLVDLFVGTMTSYLAAAPRTEWFDWDKLKRGSVKKLILLSLILTAALFDVAFAAVFGEMIRDLSPLTKYALMHALIAQGVSIARNSGTVKELRPLAALIIRRADEMKLGEKPPVRRQYDPAAIQAEQKIRESSPPAGPPAPPSGGYDHG